MRKTNVLRIMLREKPLGQESELKTQRQRFSMSRKIWSMLKSRDWQTESSKRHLMRWWLLSETVWVILKVLMMGRMGTMRMMKRQSRASWAKMTNPAGWWAQSPKRYSSTLRGFGRSRWILMIWHNQDGRMQPTTSMKETWNMTHLNSGFRRLFNPKQIMTLWHLHRQHWESLWCVLRLSPEYRKCCRWHCDQEVDISGLLWWSHSRTHAYPVVEPFVDRDTSSLLNMIPLEPVSFYSCMEPPAYHHLDFGRGWGHGDGSHVSWRIDRQSVIFDIISWRKASCIPILLHVSFFLISVTKLLDMIIRLCMCKGQTHRVKVLETKWQGNMGTMFDFYLQVTVKWQSESYISDEIYLQNLSNWCHMCHRKCGQCSWWVCMNHDRHAAFIHVSNRITLSTDLVHMVEIFEIAYGASWKSRRRSWMWIGEEVELYLPKISEMIYVPQIVGRKGGNVIEPHHISFRQCGLQLIRNWEVT